MSSGDLYAAVRNAILENNIEALEQLKLSLKEDYRAASTISSDKSFEYGLLSCNIRASQRSWCGMKI